MIELGVGATTVAHGIHYAVVGVGLAGLMALLGPQLIGGYRSRPGADEHGMRVRALTEQISSGGLGVWVTPSGPVAQAERDLVDLRGSRYLPIAVASSAAAAGVHAAVGPAHFRELMVFGLFFTVCALAQLGWAAAMILRPSRGLLIWGVIGNSAVLLLWLVTRTLGLPGLLPGPEAVGPWDLMSGIWEVAVILAAVHILRGGPERELRLPAWPNWEPSARAWALGSGLILPALAFVGVGV